MIQLDLCLIKGTEGAFGFMCKFFPLSTFIFVHHTVHTRYSAAICPNRELKKREESAAGPGVAAVADLAADLAANSPAVEAAPDT